MRPFCADEIASLECSAEEWRATVRGAYQSAAHQASNSSTSTPTTRSPPSSSSPPEDPKPQPENGTLLQ